jgi:hypothetical protein
MAGRRSERAPHAPVAGGDRPDLWSGEEKLPTAQAGAGFTGDADWNAGRSPSCLTGIRPLGTVEHGFYRASESDGPPWGGSAGTPHVGDGSAVPTPAGPPRVVACLLSFCASPRVAARGMRTAPRARWQPSGTTLPAANPCHGSRQNPSTMDGARSALLPLAKGFRLSGIAARGGCSAMSRGDG